MRTRRLFLDTVGDVGKALILTDDRAHYLRNVLRCRPGEEIHIFDGCGNERRARIDSMDRRRVNLHVMERVEPLAESPLEIVLVQAISKGDRMDATLQKACELGVSAICPVHSKRSEVRIDDKRATRKREHWIAVLRSAAEQCGRAVVPELLPAVQLDKILAESVGLRAILQPEASESLSAMDLTGKMTIAVGPEGGFEDSEIALALQHGWVGCSLGPRILRTETAGPTAIAVLQSRFGDL